MGIVLHYLLRLEPFTTLHRSFQVVNVLVMEYFILFFFDWALCSLIIATPFIFCEYLLEIVWHPSFHLAEMKWHWWYHFIWQIHRNDRVPRGIKVRHGLKSMEFSIEFWYQFHESQTSWLSESQMNSLIPDPNDGSQTSSYSTCMQHFHIIHKAVA
jgi:hypothetical protein